MRSCEQMIFVYYFRTQCIHPMTTISPVKMRARNSGCDTKIQFNYGSVTHLLGAMRPPYRHRTKESDRFIYEFVGVRRIINNLIIIARRGQLSCGAILKWNSVIRIASELQIFETISCRTRTFYILDTHFLHTLFSIFRIKKIVLKTLET